MKIKRAVGIDLGTTNSAIAVLSPEGNDLVLFEDRFKRKTLPSMVGWNPAKEDYVTGWEAWNRRVMEPAPVSSIKRKMGTAQLAKIGPHSLLPEEVSARTLERATSDMLGYLAQRANLERDDEEDSPPDEHLITSAVITVPAYFDAPQIEATRRAGELAGLEVVGLLQEPTAAAMYYAWKHNIGDGTFMVYDLGGGTFDVSIIRCLLGEYQVLGIDGDNFLGGDDLDRKLAEHLREHLIAQGYAMDLDILNDESDLTRFKLLMRVGQEIKEALSTSEVQYVGRTNLFADKEGNPISLDLEVSREQFEGMILELIKQSIQCCERALQKSVEAADVGLQQLDYVLLVGGSTRVPLVQKMVAEAFCGDGKSKATEPMLDEPDTCVALGAAIQAANVAGLTLIDELTIPSSPSQITLSSALTTHHETGRIVGRLATPNAQAVQSIVLLNASGDIAAIARPEASEDEDDHGLLFSLEEISLPDPGRYTFSLECCDAEGDALAAFAVKMVRLSPSELLRSSGSALSNPTVLAKDIYLEVVRDGRPDRQLLLRSGTSLPAEGKYRFYTTDRSGAVILRLFQNRFPIRTIHLSVPEETETGTAVDLHLSVDEAMTMVASGEVLGQTFWAQIEPPPAREQRGWDDIEALLERVERVGKELWGNEARYFQDITDPLVSGIREAARTDPDKLQVLFSRLEEALEDFHNRDTELTPGYGRYTSLINAIKRVVYRDDGKLPLGMNMEQWRARLEQLETQAEAAYAEHDQGTWSRTFNQIQAIWESLSQDEYRFVRTDDAEYARRMYIGLMERLQELRAQFEDFNTSNNPETRQIQQTELNRLRKELQQKVAQPLAQYSLDHINGQHRHELDRLAEAINYIQRQVEKLPTLGLVRH